MSIMNLLSVTLIALILACVMALVFGVRAADAGAATPPAPTVQTIAVL
ncbi:hypothetical protein [Jannaschia sp. CCS1]|nr:hypothetical protein [Jannaschia sp. CCS1]